MAASGKLLELFYDVVSPYSWLAFEVLCRYRNVWNVDLRLRPGFLGGLMNLSGNRPPAMVPLKGLYMVKDIDRLAQYCNVPLRQPSDFFGSVIEKGSLQAMRFVTAVEMKHPEFVESVSRELWMRIWSRDEDITQPESLLAAASKAGVQPQHAKELLGMISNPDVKNRLKQTTDEAAKHGAFGMPVIVVHVDGVPHMFFGSDRFELIAYLLREKWFGPVPSRNAPKL
ncbi:glutathione S-transferase kappa 1 isoform X1 [Protopterus annectens]|uniref:glutathione S-transferase kappa 1 isoform X1 n=1 Tax=Protopterus annectens TaxID=7888 RepID=UPI001CFC19B6|nr:glutathione S-transferase kappa 1 isoform X1 [Protopterus annectens]